MSFRKSIYAPPAGKSLDVLGREKEWTKKRQDKWKGRGDSGFDESMKEKAKIDEAFMKDLDLKKRFGKDAPEARSFGVNPNVAEGKMNVSRKLDMTNEELRKKFGKKAGGKVKKSKKVRGAGIAKQGVRPVKMR